MYFSIHICFCAAPFLFILLVGSPFLFYQLYYSFACISCLPIPHSVTYPTILVVSTVSLSSLLLLPFSIYPAILLCFAIFYSPFYSVFCHAATPHHATHFIQCFCSFLNYFTKQPADLERQFPPFQTQSWAFKETPETFYRLYLMSCCSMKCVHAFDYVEEGWQVCGTSAKIKKN